MPTENTRIKKIEKLERQSCKNIQNTSIRGNHQHKIFKIMFPGKKISKFHSFLMLKNRIEHLTQLPPHPLSWDTSFMFSSR